MDMLDIYTDHLICQNNATATGLSDMVDGEFSHDKVTPFLRLGDFDSKMLWKYVKPAVREGETQNGVLILDCSGKPARNAGVKKYGFLKIGVRKVSYY
ncbi:MAG: hypothetical protein WC785_04195 [Tatlockia sp.]|jgi:hypothetical protein